MNDTEANAMTDALAVISEMRVRDPFQAAAGLPCWMAIDPATERHLDRWLYREFVDSVRDEIKEAMLTEYRKDREYWNNAGWRKLYESLPLMF